MWASWDAADVADADAVDDALAFLRRSTAVAPQAEARLRTKLVERGVDEEVVDAAMVRARAERIVDDAALAAALVDERRRKGLGQPHPARPACAWASTPRRSTPLAVFDGRGSRGACVRARPGPRRAARRDEPEAAFRRIVGYLLRRGHPDGLSRKVARNAVFADREDHRI
jgi:SOS response regulatory protein OraA/RecX